MCSRWCSRLGSPGVVLEAGVEDRVKADGGRSEVEAEAATAGAEGEASGFRAHPPARLTAAPARCPPGQMKIPPRLP